MGMYDSFYFESDTLPDNKESKDCEFQTKDLDCGLDKYKVGKFGDIVVESFDGDSKDIPDGTYRVYSYEWLPHINDPASKKFEQHYEIKVRDKRLIWAKKTYEFGYVENKELKEQN